MAATKKAQTRAGALLRQRREELGLTQADVTAMGGPSHMTVRAIENGTAHDPRPWTVAALERAMSLPRGTYDVLLAGGDLPAAADDPAAELRRQAAALTARADRVEKGDQPTAVRSLRLPDDLWDQAVALADVEGRAPSVLIRDAIREYLDRNGR